MAPKRPSSMRANLKKNESSEHPSVVSEIHTMMEEIIAAAENVDAEKTFSYLTRDPGAVFFQNNKHYTRDSLISHFREKYGKLQSQKLHVTHSAMIDLGSESAIWIGYGKGLTETKAGESIASSFTETWIWQKIKGNWVATHYHG